MDNLESNAQLRRAECTISSMNFNSIREENIKFILARLQLAQALLEESDALPGRAGYDFNNEKEWWRHARHEREALVHYLLLTCFDRLGQERGFTTFQDWLSSKKSNHESERLLALQNLKVTTSPLESAAALDKQYRALYGVRNAFYRGIESLPIEIQNKLMSSVTIGFDPIYGTLGPNTSTPSYPLNDDVLERKLKLRYLYDKRNRFTHRLEQYHAASTPLGSHCNNGPSWQAMIRDSRLSYLSGHQDIVRLSNGGAYVYSTDWPFILFETLHAAVESKFHRTDIKLRFAVRCFSSKTPGEVITAEVDHDQLKEFRTLESQLWELHAKGGLPSRTR
jgi:hypothetical protein